MDEENAPASGADISTADLKQKMDELSSAASAALAQSQVRIFTTGAIITIAGIWLAYRLGRRRGRREARRSGSIR